MVGFSDVVTFCLQVVFVAGIFSYAASASKHPYYNTKLYNFVVTGINIGFFCGNYCLSKH